MVSRSLVSRILSFALLSVIVACSPATPTGDGVAEQAVIDGSIITLGNRKDNLPSVSVVRVRRPRDAQSSGCTAVLIDKQFVLTAAHCVSDSGERENVRVEFEFTPDQDKSILVKHIDIYDGYNTRTNRGDLALLTLEKPAPRGYAPAHLFEQTFFEKFKRDDITYVEYFGYGCAARPFDYKNQDCDIGTLRKGSTNQAVFFNDFIQWKSGKGSVCSGDSGGPAFVYRGKNFYLAGIASYVASSWSVELQQELQLDHGGDKWSFYTSHPELTECPGQGSYTDLRPYKGWILERQEFRRSEIR